MKTYLLTNKDAALKIAALYALPIDELARQAKAVKSNFTVWLNENFELSYDELTYFKNLNKNANTYYGELCALCFFHQLPITLLNPPDRLVRSGIWINCENSIRVSSDEEGRMLVTGEVIFSVRYQ